MDKLHWQLNHLLPRIGATRIITEPPSDTIRATRAHLTVVDELPAVEEPRLSTLHPLQEKIIQVILSHPAPNKILYIGSRIDNYRKQAKGFCISVGSGALFVEEMLAILKQHNVKIVVCCLELVYHTRSLEHSFRLYETIRHHLQYADAIHYLTQADKDYMENSVPPLLLAGKRLVSPHYPLAQIEQLLAQKKSPRKTAILLNELHQFMKTWFQNDYALYSQYFDYFHQAPLINKLQNTAGVYASGICTIQGLCDEEVSIDRLIERPPNVLVFGLIRSHKGIEEGIALGRYFKNHGATSTVYIVGKVLAMTSLFRIFFKEVFDESSIQEKGIDLNKRMMECNRSYDLNTAFQKLYDDLVVAEVTKKASVVLALNVSEQELKSYSSLCRYALKLDNKGFAENASSMISTMIGLCLPVLGQKGLVTPDFVDDFSPALHLLNGALIMHGTEIMPAPAPIKEIASIVFESVELYQARLEAILRLRASKRFDVSNTINILIEQVFSPAEKPHQETNHGPMTVAASTLGFFPTPSEVDKKETASTAAPLTNSKRTF